MEKIRVVIVNSAGHSFRFEIGEMGVKKITRHSPRGEGDTTYVTVENENGSKTDYYNVETVRYVDVNEKPF